MDLFEGLPLDVSVRTEYDQSMNNDTIRTARNLAIRQRNGETLTDVQRRLIAAAVDYMSPENFYMDGELFE